MPKFTFDLASDMWCCTRVESIDGEVITFKCYGTTLSAATRAADKEIRSKMATVKKSPTVTRARKTTHIVKSVEVKKFPSILASYPDDWKAYLTALEVRASRVMAMGIPGTGKTFSANHVGLKEGEEVYNIYVGDETAAYQFMGTPSIKGGDSTFEYGPAIHAMVTGSRLVVNEIHKASMDALDALTAVCDDPRSIKVTLPDGSHIRPTEGFHVVATMNGTLADLPEQLRDRFEGCAIEITAPHPAAIESLPQEIRAAAKKLTRAECPEGQRVSIRQFRGFVELIEKGMDRKMAGTCAFGKRSADLLATMSLAAARA